LNQVLVRDFGNENLITSFLKVQRYESRSSRKTTGPPSHPVSEVLALKGTEV